MTRCASFVHCNRNAEAWSRCPHAAQRGDVLCSSHRDVLDGLVLGIFQMNLSFHAHQQGQAARHGGKIESLQTCRIAILTPQDILANRDLAEGSPDDASSIVVDERAARRALAAIARAWRHKKPAPEAHVHRTGSLRARA